MGEMIKLTASDGVELNAYTAKPAGTPRGGVVVIQEVWGVNHWVRGVADDYAGQGYFAVAPAVFDRIQPGYESENYGEEQYLVIRELLKGFNPVEALKDVEAAVKHAASAGKVGITGFCLGGMLTWRAANAGLGLSAGSGYYGGGVPNYIDLAPKIPLEMHFGEKDTGIPLEQIEQLRQRYPQVPIFLYDAGHGFANSDAHRYVKAAADLAFQRTLEFFGKHLG
jgi:carboxymethylenebutenolidase